MTRDEAQIRSIPRANRIVTNGVLPVGALITIFAGVVGTGFFALMLHPDIPVVGWGASLVPWFCAFASSLAIFMGCYGVSAWQRERERLRRYQAGE